MTRRGTPGSRTPGRRAFHPLSSHPANHRFSIVTAVSAHVIRLQPLQRLIDLLRRRGSGASVELSHQEDFLAVAIAQSLAHPGFAFAIAVAPAIVEEVN